MTTEKFVWQLSRGGSEEILEQFTATIAQALSILAQKGFKLKGSVWYHDNGLSIRTATIFPLERLDVEDYKT